MFLGALIDLGADLDVVRQALAPLPTDRPFEITTQRVLRCGIGGIDLKVRAASTAHHHHHTGHRQIMAMIEQLDTTDRAKTRAAKVVTLLAQAEARVHQTTVEHVHFHEVGAIDSIVDILGSAVALEQLEITSLSCGVLPISRGLVRCAHGQMPVPAPATAYLLQGMPTAGVDRAGELVTPTGAALAAGLCDHLGPPPPMILEAVGYGAGDREDPDIPNLLRLMLGQQASTGPLTPAPGAVS